MNTSRLFSSRKSPLEVRTTYFNTSKKSMNKTSTLINSVRDRHKLFKKVQPEQAAEVLKTYIVPLFEQKIRNKSNETKSATNTSLNLSMSKGPVPEEILLSSRLYSKLQESEVFKVSLLKKCSELEQIQVNAYESVEKYEVNIKNLESTVKVLSTELGLVYREIEMLRYEQKMNVEDLQMYKNLNQKLSKENFELNQALNYEKARNDIRLICYISLTVHIRIRMKLLSWNIIMTC